jgi:hypothetical protein
MHHPGALSPYGKWLVLISALRSPTDWFASVRNPAIGQISSGEYDTARVRFSHSDEFVGMFMPYELKSSICSKLCAFMTEPCTSRTLFGQDQLINELLRDE